MGAGEILLTAIHKEGTGSGFDNILLKELTNKVNIPVIASGGAGSLVDIKEVILETEINAVCIASIFHYDLVKKKKFNFSNKNYEEGNTSFLEKKIEGFRGDLFSVEELKSYLLKNDINCRTVV